MGWGWGATSPQQASLVLDTRMLDVSATSECQLLTGTDDGPSTLMGYPDRTSGLLDPAWQSAGFSGHFFM